MLILFGPVLKNRIQLKDNPMIGSYLTISIIPMDDRSRAVVCIGGYSFSTYLFKNYFNSTDNRMSAVFNI